MSMDVHRGTMRLVKYDVHGSFLDSLQLSWLYFSLYHNAKLVHYIHEQAYLFVFLYSQNSYDCIQIFWGVPGPTWSKGVALE